MGKRISIDEGRVYAGPRHIRRVVSVVGEIIAYSRGDDRIRLCKRETFLRFLRRASDITNAEIELHTRDLLGGVDVS